MLGALQWLDRTTRRNRWRDLGPSGRAGAVVGVLAACVGLALAGNAILEPSVIEGRAERIQGWTFWCMLIAAIVFGYSSFEVLYRDALWRRLSILPVSPRALFGAKVLRVYRVHAPLLLLPAATGAPLLAYGGLNAWLVAVAATGIVWVVGLAVAVFAHVWAGESLIDGESTLKAYLSQGFGPTDAAFLFYSPAIALLFSSIVALAVEVGFTAWRVNDTLLPLLGVVAVGLLGAVVALRRASAIFIRWQHMIAPRFADVEVLPPWREGELPRRAFGTELAGLLPEGVRPVWTRLVVQYRRRFRVVIPLMVVLTGALLAYASRTDADAVRVWALGAVMGIVVFLPAIRACGPELGAGAEARALPVPRSHDTLTLALLTALEWLPLAAGVAVGGVLSGDLAAMGGAALALLAFGAVVNGVAIPLCLHASPRIGRVSVAIRGVSLLVVGLIASGF